MRSAPVYRLTPERARRVRVAAQGLPGAPGAELLPAIERTGFVRTLGGVDVYLAVRARVPGMTRADLDGAVERRAAQVLPAARGCIYLVPRRDAAIALKFADLRTRARAESEHERAGIRLGELDDVCQAVTEALARAGPLTTDALRRALPEGVVRGLGADGKKVGISSIDAKRRREIEAAAADTARFLADHLGHGRSFSLDKDDDLRRRAEIVRAGAPFFRAGKISR